MRKSKGRGEKTAANGRARMERGNECGRRESAQKDGAGVVVKKKRVLAWRWQGESV